MQNLMVVFIDFNDLLITKELLINDCMCAVCLVDCYFENSKYNKNVWNKFKVKRVEKPFKC